MNLDRRGAPVEAAQSARRVRSYDEIGVGGVRHRDPQSKEFNMTNTSKTRLALASLALFGATQAAHAEIVFSTGNQQYTNVNIAADVDATTIVGDIGNTGITMTFENMIGPDGTTQVSMHGQHGVAFVESYLDSLAGATHTGFSSITLRPQDGYGFTAGDFKLDELNGLNDGFVTLFGFDQLNNPFSQTFALGVNGQNPYQFTTSGGELVTKLVFTVATNNLLQDLKQVSVDVAAIPAIPEPGTYGMMAFGLAGMALWRRRQSR
jgi:hypothetical protein